MRQTFTQIAKESIVTKRVPFREDAKRFAHEVNIQLRNVEDVTADDIRAAIPITAPVVYREGCFTAVQLVVIPEELDIEDFDPNCPDRIEFLISNDDKVFRNTETGEGLSLLDLWRQLLKANGALFFEGLGKPGDVIEKKIDVQESVLRKLRIELDGRRGKIVQLVFTATMTMYMSRMPLEYFKNYDGKHYVAHWGEYEGEENFTVILTRKSDAKPEK